MQGSRRALRVRHSARNLTDGGGLVLVRKLFDRFGLAAWIDRGAENEKGFFRPGLMTEVWIVLLLYGGGVMDELPLLDCRGVRRIFGWVRVPDPTTFGRWLRRSGKAMVPLLDTLLWKMVRQRWAMAGGAPKQLTVMMDSTVVVRYGKKQAGAERGYNPKKRGRPSRHPLLAYIRETGDCLGVRWRAGSAHTAEGAEEWLEKLVERLRGAGVRDITVRLDKGFFSRRMVRTLERLGVSFLLTVPRHGWLNAHCGHWRFSARGEAVFPGEDVWTATGTPWGARLLTVHTPADRQPRSSHPCLRQCRTRLCFGLLSVAEGPSQPRKALLLTSGRNIHPPRTPSGAEMTRITPPCRIREITSASSRKASHTPGESGGPRGRAPGSFVPNGERSRRLPSRPCRRAARRET